MSELFNQNDDGDEAWAAWLAGDGAPDQSPSAGAQTLSIRLCRDALIENIPHGIGHPIGTIFLEPGVEVLDLFGFDPEQDLDFDPVQNP